MSQVLSGPSRCDLIHFRQQTTHSFVIFYTNITDYTSKQKNNMPRGTESQLKTADKTGWKINHCQASTHNWYSPSNVFLVDRHQSESLSEASVPKRSSSRFTNMVDISTKSRPSCSPSSPPSAKFYLSSAIITNVSSFGYVIYSPTDLPCSQYYFEFSWRITCTNKIILSIMAQEISNLACWMAERLVNIMTLILWRYIPYPYSRMRFSLEYHLTWYALYGFVKLTCHNKNKYCRAF